MKKSIITLTIMLAAGALIAVFSSPAAAIQGACYDCHTMHNSQGGSEMATGGPYTHLLAGNCVGCHTGTNTVGSKPYVLSTAAPTFGTNTLAGGNFYWVADAGGDDDTKGHNVYGISIQDNNITEAEGAPGAANAGCGATGDNCHASLAGSGGGCEGCHLTPAHHNNSTGTVTTAPWFRWLSGHMGGSGSGVSGIEDDDWDFETTVDHNEYLGNSATKTSAGSLSASGDTMTGFCCGCHGNFHIEQDGSSSWVRHPSDAVIPASGEYEFAFGSAGGGAAANWDPTVPVARPNLGTIADTTKVNPGTDMVMCLSCHVAHGSPYSDMLRWDYDLMVLGTTGAGQGKSCFVCHTQKDG